MISRLSGVFGQGRASIRTRIALTILAASTAALLAMALAVFLTFRTVLKENFDDTLRAASTTNLGLIDVSISPPSLKPAPSLGIAPSEDEAFVRLYAADGSFLSASPNSHLDADALADEQKLVANAAQGKEHFATIHGIEKNYRDLAVPVRQHDRVVAILVTSIEPVSVQESLNALKAIMLVVVPLTGGLLAIAAFLIARQALQPVRAITSTARRIAAGDLHQRIQGVVVQDEVGELASTFNMMIDRVEEAFERERRFTGDASHELRTPLTAMETALEVTLSQERTPDEYRDALQTLQSRTSHLTRMARQLLMLSRLDADALRPTFTAIELGGLLSAIVSSFEDDHPGMTVEMPPVPEDARIRGDPEMLARAFTNVLENSAIHAGPAAQVRVETSLASDEVEITFSDNGPGVPPELLNSVFERFRRNDGAKATGGAGLGLAIVESIIRLHGGRVTVRNNDGAVFVFHFPVSA